MGCGSSKVDDLPVVALCRERRDLIRAAAGHRFALASRHESYFRALESVGEALHRFVQEELTVVPTPSTSSGAPSSPVLTIPSSEGKAPKSKTGSRSGSGGEDAGGGGSSSSLSSLTHSPSPEGSHLHFSSGSETEEIPEGEGGGAGGEPYQYTWPGVPSPYYNYMRHSSAIPTMVYQAPFAGYGYTEPYGVPDGYFGAPVGSAPPGDASSYYYYGTSMSPQKPPAAAPQPPPPPPAPEGSTWDFLNPFESYEHIYSSYRFGSVPSSPNSSEVREQEGIPDLEEETEPEPMKEPSKGKKRVSGDLGKEPGPSSSKSVPAHEKNATELEDKGSKSSSEGGYVKCSEESSSFGDSGNCSTSKSSGRGSKTGTWGGGDKLRGVMEEDTKKKEVTFELGTSLPTEKSGPTLEAALSTEGTRNVTEVAKEIKEQFKMAASSGTEVSAMLEVGKLRYQSTNAAFREISSRILDSFPMLANSCHSFKGAHFLNAHSLKIPKVRYGNFANSVGMRSGNLSSTLEKLSVWEKKLYKEVKDEERLRVIYEKQCKRLKNLDDRGAESHKIDATRASIRKLLTKIDISIKSVDVISSRIHKLRDEELQPQLIELVQGLIRMWKSMLDCHQKQFLAIAESKSRNLMAKTSIQRGSVAKLTRELELELLHWLSTFNEWISIQRVYFRTLNEWLQKCLYPELEETPDGVAPYSPGKLGAPAAFVICNDWCEAMEKISEDDVIVAVQTFAAGVHQLWESQDEEERQKLRAEYLSKDLAGRLRSLQNDTGLPVLQDGSSNTAISLTENANASLHGRMVSLESMRKRLEEETAKHEEVVKQINAAARTGLRTGLVPIFHALGSFSLDTLKAYEKIRISQRAGS
ncbi:hypothetical protein Taro_003485 [Colocasia esculenta]|uniref:Uncharacterized protein n=1 Tax=Colocasia esculenta TaxID=4460 RepID=A0A843TP21_COLES|nr:hypothetical protein [Colocasia esculenta]